MATICTPRTALLLTTILGGVHGLPAMANPTGGTVVAGGVKIAGEGTTTVTVTQSTDRAIIDWRSFDIKADETTRFVQPRAESITLNRITNGLPTEILGKLEANGNVFIVNGNGVVFGQGSQVNVGGLVVSTADTDGRAFLRSTGQYRFDQTGSSDAEIIVEGTINVKSAGVAAFVAPRFSNRGVVRATLGRIAIGAADRFTLDMAGDGLIRFAPADGFGRSSGGVAVENSGVLDASGGLIEISAFAARDAINGSVRVDGMVTAGGATRNADGTVSLTGSGGRIAIGATGRVDVGQAGTLQASGADGGSITINSLSINNDGVISADGARAGGTVRIDGIGVATLGGQIAATGGDTGGTIAVNAFNIASAGEITATGGTGSGGMIEVIAANRLMATTTSRIDASGAAGGSIMVAGGTGTGQGLFSSGAMLADGRTLTGGSIAINGRHIDLVAATGSAEGATGGGQISVGHERLADGTIAINAATVELSPATRLSVSALGNGNAGRIDVWSSDLTRAWGSTNARGGTLGGDGGFIELSSRGELVFGGSADASAPLGARGLLLLDPRNLTIDDAATRFPQYQLLDPNANAGNLFGATVIALSTGNAVVTSTGDDFSASDAGAVYLFNLTTGALISTLRGSSDNDQIGNGGITALTNGNYVVRSANWRNGAATNAGAVTFGSGTSGVSGAVSAMNSLVGTTANDQIGNGGITALTSGNYVVRSVNWDNGAAVDAGAVTFGSGTTGVSGAVSAANSLVGTTINDRVGFGVTTLTNGNYVVESRFWANGAATNAGAVTFGSGTTGVSGAVSATNSLVGTTANDLVGFTSGGVTGIRALTNGNYVVLSLAWSNGGAATNAGAVTFGSGTTGVSGAVSATNSLVGTTTEDRVGNGGITELTNGNYVVLSPTWANGAATGAGAVTFGSGTTGVSGVVSASNSLVGTTTEDRVGNGGITVLTNGNYVVGSQNWDNGAATNAGAVTFGNGTTGLSGAVTAANSLVGTTTNDNVGNLGVTALTNGNYVVTSRDWGNGAATQAGAVTFGSGTTGVSGVVSATNSLVGTSSGDQVGVSGITALTNGNYVVRSLQWDNGAAFNAGAVTFGSGTTGISGAVSAMNSLVGTTAFDSVGNVGVIVLTNGNYVVGSQNWDNGLATNAGAVTFGSGTTGVSGAVSAMNSLVGTTAFDQVGNGLIFKLTNGNYVVRSPFWNNGAATRAGAVTFGSGATGVSGAVSATNSLVGTTTEDRVGITGIRALTNGNYVVASSAWDNVDATDAGAVTFGNGTAGVSGAVSAMNSLVGTTANDQVGNLNITALTNGNYVVQSVSWDNGTALDAGAVTFGSGTTGVSGVVTAMNSLVGTTAGDNVGITGITLLTNGNYVVRSSIWDNGLATNAGAVTFGSGTTGVSGAVTAMNSLVGTTTSDNVGSSGVTALTNGNYVVLSPNWANGAATQAGAVTFGSGTSGISGAVSTDSSLVGTTTNSLLNYVPTSPLDLVIANSATDGGSGRVYVGVSGIDADPNTLTYSSSPGIDVTISSAAIRRVLDTGTALTLQANNDITVNSAIAVNNPTGNGGAFTLAAGRSIFINAAITSDNGNVSLFANDLLANGVIDAQRASGNAVISFGASGSISAGTGNVAIELRDGTGKTNFASGGITLGSLTGSAISVLNTRADATSGITINSGATLTASGTGNALILSGRSFTNNAGANALTLTGGGRFLVYSNDYDVDMRGGIVGGNLYNRSFATTPPLSITQTGSQFIFTRQPILTVTANNATREYGLANPTFTGAVTGLVNGDTLAQAVTGALQFTTTATQASNVGSFAINVDTTALVLSDIGYGFGPSSMPGTLTITQALLSVMANNATREYGLANPAFTGTVTGFRNGDTDSVISGLVYGSTATQASNVGSFAINGSGASATNYNFAYTPGTLTITQALLSVMANNATREYGLANPAFTGTVTGFRNGDTASVISGLVYGSTATQASNVGSFAINGSGASATNYNFAYTPGTLTITQALLSVMANNATREYGLANPTFTGTVTGFRNGDTASVISGLVYGSTATQASNVGSFAINGSGASATNYNFAYTPGTLTITQALLSVMANNATREYGLANPTFTGTVTGFRNGDTASVISGLVYGSTATQASNVGSFAINGSGASATNYNFAYTPGTLTITQALLSVTANNATREYGLANPAFTGTVTGFRNGDTDSVISGLVYGSTATQASNVGSFAINGSGASATNYSFAYTPGTLTITQALLSVTANNATREYGLANPAFTGTVTGFRNGDTASVISGLFYGSTATQASNVGSFAINGSGASATNYNFAYTPGTLTITQALLSVTANNATREYGLANPAFTGTVTGFRNGDTASVISGLFYGSTATQASNVGSFAINGSGASATNYNFAYTPGTLTITQALLSVMANNATREYGLANPAFTGTVTGFRNGDTDSVISGLVYGSTATQASNVGSFAINGSGASATNYNFAYTPGTLTITQALLSVMANNATREYGLANPAFTGTVTGFRNGDTASVISGLVYGSTATQASNVGSFAINGSGASATNYNFAYTPGTLTITQALLSVMANNATREYGLANPTFTGTVTGFRNGDTASVISGLVYGSTATQASNVGSFAINGSGASATNYNFAYTPGTLTITQALLSVMANNATREYGLANPTFTGTVTGFRNGDTASVISGLVYGSTATQASNVGSFAINGSGASATNYNFAYTPGTLTITQALLSVTANNATREYGLANPAFTGTVTGFRNGDTDSVISGLVYGSTATQASNVGSFAINGSGASATNYSFAYTPGTLTITQALLSVTANNATREYGLANPAFTGTVTGFRNGDTASVISGLFYGSTATQASNVGSFAINGSGASATNYNFAYTPGTLTITQALLSVTANNATREYGLANPAFTGTVTGFRNGDTASVISGLFYGSTATQASNVGSFAINGSGASATNYNFAYTPGTLTITQALLSVMANNATREYGLANPTFTGTVTGFRNGDAASVISGLVYGSTATQASNVGSFAINGSGASATNYNFAYTPGTLTITQALLSVMANNATREYGLANPAFTGTVTGFRNGDTDSVISGLVYGSTATQASNVGSFAINGSGASATNYNFAYTPGTLTITQALLSVMANNATREYGLANPAFTGTVTGFRNGDTASVISGLVYGSTATQASNVGSFAINGSGASATNYNFAYTPGTLTITQALLSVMANNATREYGLANPAFTGTVTGFRNGDTDSVISGLVYGSTATQASNVGSFAINGSGASATNYNFAYTPGTLTITQALLSVMANNATREYGLANPAFTGTVTGFRNGDTDSVISGLVYGSTATQASNVGSFAINGSGASATNYNFAYTPGTLTITQALLSVMANNATREYGLANPAFTGTVTGFRNGDTASVISGLVYGSTATQASNVGSFAINGSGASATNYNFAYTPGTLTITQALLSVTANNATREYGIANPTFTGTVTGFRSGDTASVISGLVYGSTATQASNVGSFAINGSGASATNYSFAYTPGTLTITQALLSVMANNATREVNQPNPMFTGTITGFRNNDTASVISGLTFNTTATQTSPSGSFAIIGSGASATNYRFTFLPGTLTVQMSAEMPVEVPSFLTRGVQVSQDSQSNVIAQPTGATGNSGGKDGEDTTILIQCVVPDGASSAQAVPC